VRDAARGAEGQEFRHRRAGTTRHAGYGVSQRKRKLVEEASLGQDHRWLRQGQGARLARVGFQLHAGNGSLQTSSD